MFNGFLREVKSDLIGTRYSSFWDTVEQGEMWDVAGRKVSVGRTCGLWGWNGGHVQEIKTWKYILGMQPEMNTCTHIQHVHMHTQIQYTHKHTPAQSHHIIVHTRTYKHTHHTFPIHSATTPTYHTYLHTTHNHHTHMHTPTYTRTTLYHTHHTHITHTYRIAGNFSRVKIFADWSLWTFLRFNFRGQDSPGE